MGFIFDVEKGETAEDLKRRRRLAEAMLHRATGRVPQSLGEGLAVFGQALGGRLRLNAAESAQRAQTAKANSLFANILRGPGSSSVTSQPTSFEHTSTSSNGFGDLDEFNKSLAHTESGGRYNIRNKEGFTGKYQFGQPRLDDFNRANSTKYSTNDLLKSPDLQEQVQAWHVGDIDNFIKQKGLDKFVGQTVKGVPITPNGMRAMAHLGGVGGLQKFLQTGGRYNPADSNGTSLADYARTHAGGSASAAPQPAPPVVTPTASPPPVAPGGPTNIVPQMPPQAPQPTPQPFGGFPRQNPQLPGMRRIDTEGYTGGNMSAFPLTGAQPQLPPQAAPAAPQMAQPGRAMPQPVNTAPQPSQGGLSDMATAAARFLSQGAGTPEQRAIAMSIVEQELAQRKPLTPKERIEQQLDELRIKKAERELNAPAKREVIKGADGFNYFQDTGERVLPNVEPKPGFRTLSADEVKAQGFPPGAYQMGPDGKIYSIGKSGVTVNVGQGEVGKIPPGYELFTDPETGGRSMRPIAGGPVADKQAAEARAAEAKQQQEAITSGIVTQDIKSALDVVEKNKGWSTGLAGRLLNAVPGTEAFTLKSYLQTIKANAGFDKLQKMREASPTGGALGQVSERELDFLQATLGNLDQAQDATILARNLRRIEQIYAKAAAYPNAAEFGFASQAPAGQAGPPDDIEPEVWELMTPEERALWN